jgi:hypothetical protein
VDVCRVGEALHELQLEEEPLLPIVGVLVRRRLPGSVRGGLNLGHGRLNQLTPNQLLRSNYGWVDRDIRALRHTTKKSAAVRLSKKFIRLR